MVVTRDRGRGVAGRVGGVSVEWVQSLSVGWWKSSRDEWWWWLHNNVEVLNVIEMYIQNGLKRQLLSYVYCYHSKNLVGSISLFLKNKSFYLLLYISNLYSTNTKEKKTSSLKTNSWDLQPTKQMVSDRVHKELSLMSKQWGKSELYKKKNPLI